MHSKYQTPYISIIVCSCIVSLLILRPLADLLIMDICLYTAGISLEFAALISLRKKAADADRPFRIPLQEKGLIILFLAPMLVFGIALGSCTDGFSRKYSCSIGCHPGNTFCSDSLGFYSEINT